MRTNISAPELKPFDNLVSRMILITIIGLFFGGIVLMVFGSSVFSFIGLVCSCIGALWYMIQTRDFAFPKAGVLTVWGKPITVGGRSLVVSGKTILANFFPLYIGAIEVDMKNVDFNIKNVTVQTLDKVTMNGEISLTLYPAVDDMVDYLRAGGSMTAIFEQLDDIAIVTAREKAKSHHSNEISTDNRVVGQAVKDAIEQHSFGVVVFKCQTPLSLPIKVIDAQNAMTVEVSERETEKMDYETLRVAALELQRAYQADPLMAGKVPDLRTCLDEVLRMKLLKEGGMKEVRGGIGILNI